LLERDRLPRPDLAAQLRRRWRRGADAELTLHDRWVRVAVKLVDAVREGHVPGPGALLEGGHLVDARAEQVEVVLGRRVEVGDRDRVVARIELTDARSGRVLERNGEARADAPGQRGC